MGLAFTKSAKKPSSFDTGNTLLVPFEFALGLQEQDSIENMLSIVAEGSWEPHERPDPSAQEDPSAPTWTETPCSPKEPQVSINPAPTPHFYVEPLTIVPPEMRSLSEEENEDNEEDYDNMALASFISVRSRKTPPKEPTNKRTTTRLQKKEALESVLKKNKEEKKKRRLVKGGKLVNEEVVPLAFVIDIDDEVNEEHDSLVRKSSKKPTVLRSRKESSVSVMDFSNVGIEESGEKVTKKSGEKESDEKGSEKSVCEKVSEKSTDKGKSVRKSVKRKVGANKEPGSSKKAKVGVTKDVGRKNLRNQKWTHFFTNESPKVYEVEVRIFYANFFTIEDENICINVNGVDFVIDEVVLGTISGVPTGGISSIEGTCSQNFRNAILKDNAVQQGERVHKKALLLVYILIFEMVNKVLLPHAERHSTTSRADLFLREALDACTTINLTCLVIEHMKKVADFMDGNHGFPYGLLLTKVFELFKVPLRKTKVGTRKQSFSMTNLEECECIDKREGVGSNSTISQLIEAQNIITEEIRKLKSRNAIIEGQLSQATKAPGSSSSQGTKVARLTKENVDLRK
uniref:Putative plant transposon protein domain-containing protein n=1 Tax=Nicotiana tabacum TaxID=4097 RepID=A0A1S3XWQ3_TOBAC|nr:PREDICTED: uncharacterized protein LOC107769592 [Nicotiana tabacum]